jgi:hypothetical protein
MPGVVGAVPFDGAVPVRLMAPTHTGLTLV